MTEKTLLMVFSIKKPKFQPIFYPKHHRQHDKLICSLKKQKQKNNLKTQN